MSTMKQARFPAKNVDLEITNVPIPEVKAGEVRMRVHACGVCHSDVYPKAGVMGNSFPRAPGHEVAGVVDTVGEGVKKFKKGDRIGLGWFGGCCHSCSSCREDELANCSKLKVTGISFDGGYGEYVVAVEEAFASIPDDLSFEQAAPLMCAGVTCFNSIRHQTTHPGSLVAVQGLGGLGHLAVQYANKMGYEVVALSSGDEKKDLAMKLGARHYINTSSADAAAELMKLGGASLIVCTAPHAKAISPLVKGLKVGGKVLVLAAPHENIEVSALDLITKKASIGGWASGDSRDSEDTMKFALTTGVQAQIEVFPLDKAQEALDRMLSNKARFRCVLKMA